jgi:hypothetical protein
MLSDCWQKGKSVPVLSCLARVGLRVLRRVQLKQRCACGPHVCRLDDYAVTRAQAELLAAALRELSALRTLVYVCGWRAGDDAGGWVWAGREVDGLCMVLHDTGAADGAANPDVCVLVKVGWWWWCAGGGRALVVVRVCGGKEKQCWTLVSVGGSGFVSGAQENAWCDHE